MGVYRKALSAIAVAIGACAAMQAASATTITVTGMEYKNPVSATIHWSQNGWQPLREAVNVGAFNATVGNVSLEAWCVDIFQQTTFGSAVGDFSSASADTILSTLGQFRVAALQNLAAEALNQVDNAKTSAAFQLAIWEIVNETGSAYDLSTGAFTVSDVSKNDVSSLAQGWLDNLPTTSNYKFDLWTSPSHQDLISFKAPATSVPEPGTIAVGGLGVLALAMSRRRGAGNKSA